MVWNMFLLSHNPTFPSSFPLMVHTLKSTFGQWHQRGQTSPAERKGTFICQFVHLPICLSICKSLFRSSHKSSLSGLKSASGLKCALSGLKLVFSGSNSSPQICPLGTSGNSPLCPALTPLLQQITPSRALGTADHVRSLND